ncbi:hypothetical protein P1P70_45075, partial [Streptomyces sp. MB09-02B]|nr:hypothetical protein [Streptomyces sp. MB09-02B]
MSRIRRMRRSRFLASSIGVTCAAALALPAALPATASAATPTDSSSAAQVTPIEDARNRDLRMRLILD